MESTEVIQDTSALHETCAPDSAVAEGREGLDAKAKGLQARSKEAGHCSMVEDGAIIQIGGGVTVQPVIQPHKCTDATPHEVVEEGCAAPIDFLQTPTGREIEHSSDSVSNAKFTFRPNQGSTSSDLQRERKPRKAESSVRVPDIRTPISQPLTPYDNFADQSLEDNENRSSTKKLSKQITPVASLVYEDNDPSTTRRQSQRGAEGTFNRRLAFTPLPQSELNIRMGCTPNRTPEKRTPTRTMGTLDNFMPIHVSHPIPIEEDEVTFATLSLQQAGPITAEELRDGSDIASEDADETGSIITCDCSDEENTIESALDRLSVEIYGHSDLHEHHDSDKENMPVHEMFLPGPGSITSNLPSRFNEPRHCSREPLQTLCSAPSPPMYQSPHTFTIPASYQLLRARSQVESGRQWQMVADTNCLLDAESLKSLKHLEGIHETRLIIPNIVVRELDYLQKQESWRVCASDALQWIEACMLKIPSWIHVQSSGETVHVGTTPPLSPSIYFRGPLSHVGESDMMHPTLHDYVLECALFQQAKLDGRVAILTDQTTLKIKALAEGLVVDTATSFSDSLLNPYSDRFVYASSVPVIRAAGHPRKKSHGFSASVSATSSSNQLAPSVWPKSWPTSKAHFLIWLESQPVGLLALLAELDKSESYDFHI
ncbi:uncharacterized protein [Physcomitrium patens]|uniref:PIN domain-containing protein n=1 Tax=Physcomitrium patens TaxID=3218 RepID=A0A2K1J7C0_PHYPA|nr:uncharacterized protein LOC112293005 isoform X2 [Physcomitrium patens]PNR37421.1 hypothetical protein PHYPA_020530 [Physcomitrium patens]|eukprot:XP_024397807.1 uncharacterized protein LOC112293005 isoform X2 [Physcomitrella patens]